MSPYPVLDNRPIDQWKVVELKEELKRRKLTTRGLKDDLIKRLDEALRVERENTEREKAEREIAEREIADRERTEKERSEKVKAENEKQVDIGIESDPPITSSLDYTEAVVFESTNAAGQNYKNDVDDARAAIDTNEGFTSSDNALQVGGVTFDTDPGKREDIAAPISAVETSVEVTTAGSSVEVKENTVVEVAISGPDLKKAEIQGGENPEKQDGRPDDKLDVGYLKPRLESGDLKIPPQEDIILNSSTTNNQVSEVSPNLGIKVKSDSVNNDYVSVNKNNVFKDNITADNIKLELDVVKPESSDIVPAGGKSHPMDVEEPHKSKAAVEEDKNYSMSADMNKNNEIADMVYSEKLNLDQSSGDDSMDEDVPGSKHIDSTHEEEEIGNKNEKSEVIAVKEEPPIDILGDADEKNIVIGTCQQTALAEKRKLTDGGNGSDEPVKRQRRWNSESVKVPEPQGSNLATTTTTTKDSLETPTSKRNFSRSNSNVSNDAPKERVVPPPQKPPTNSLFIDRFLRPFTLKAVQELLGKTGTVERFWMDNIKTHCYVTYSSVEEAVETRNAVYNLQWPPNGGHLLVAEFVEPEEVKSRLEAPPQAPAAAPTPAPQTSQPPPRQQAAPPKQQLPPPPALPLPAQERERGGRLPPPPAQSEQGDPTIVTLDILFRKTKATPRIYYLPLSDEQVAAKRSRG